MIKLANIVVIEGPDRIGKFTQTNLLVDKLKNDGKKVAFVEVPINDKITYPLIYWMLRNGMAKRFANLFQFVQFLNKFIFQIIFLPFLLLKNDYVVFDRWAMSAIVYGNVCGADSFFVNFLDSFLISPTVTIVLSGAAHIQGDEDVYEKDHELQATVREYYKIITQDYHACELVNANQTREKVHSQILEYFNFYCRGV